MSRPAAVALLAVALLAPATALTQSSLPPAATLNTTYRFATVDSFELQGVQAYNGYAYNSWVTVTGVLQGESAPTTLRFSYSTALLTSSYESSRTFERCERFALLAMNKPGQFQFDLRQEGSTTTQHLGCKLTRLPPPAAP